MIYPKSIEKGKIIATTALSDGIKDIYKQKRLDNAIKNIEKMGYKFLETPNVRMSEKARSAPARKRAEQFIKLWKNEDVQAIIMATGGDFLLEALDYIDFEELKKYPAKWVKGFSDVTGISFILTTLLDIATIYSENIPAYGAEPIYKSELDAIEIMKGNLIRQNNFEKYEVNRTDYSINPYVPIEFSENVEWKNLNGEERIHFKGRAIGGCFDVIRNIIGTKYDNVKNYIEKYKKDGIVWFLEIFNMDTATLFLNLWQMKNAGYFENCNGIIFGRSLFLQEVNNIDFVQTINDVIGNLNIPVIYDADFGHRAPQISMVNGAILEIESSGGKGYVDTFFE